MAGRPSRRDGKIQLAAWWRLLRDRLALGAVLLLATFGVAAGHVTREAQVRLTEAVDENWRGAYDILVRPGGSRSDLEAAQNLVEPNFLEFTGHGGITVGQWHAIQSVSNVEVAAPVAVAGFIRLAASAPIVFIPDDVPGDGPALYEMDVTVSTSDGIEQRELSQHIGYAVLPYPTADGTRWHTLMGGSVDAGVGASLEFPASLDVYSPLVAVDPESETMLLNGSDIFGALVEAGDSPTVADFDDGLILQDYGKDRLALGMAKTEGADLDRPVIPVIVSDRSYAPLTASLTVYQVGQDLDSEVSNDDPELISRAMSLREGSDSTLVGETTLDLSETARPFRATPIDLPWPGSVIPQSLAGQTLFRSADSLDSLLPGPLKYRTTTPRPDSDAISLEVVPVADGYRTVEREPLALQPSGPGVLDEPFFLAPVGTFDLGAIDRPDNPLNWAPLGAYDPPGTNLVAAPDGTPLKPTAMTPDFDVSAILQPPPLAFTDIGGAAILRGAEPIDAIRIRVAGVGGFDAASRPASSRWLGRSPPWAWMSTSSLAHLLGLSTCTSLPITPTDPTWGGLNSTGPHWGRRNG